MRDAHLSHPEVLQRLRRASGHLKAVIEMIEASRPCLDIAQQLHAVVAAVEGAKRLLIHDHLDHCLERALGAGATDSRPAVEEFKAITKYL